MMEAQASAAWADDTKRSRTSVMTELSAYTVRKHGRFWEVLDATGTLVCMTVYKCGAREVIRRLGG